MKEIYFYLDGSVSNCKDMINCKFNYESTKKAIEQEKSKIYTTSLVNLSFDLLDKGYKIFLCKGLKK